MGNPSGDSVNRHRGLVLFREVFSGQDLPADAKYRRLLQEEVPGARLAVKVLGLPQFLVLATHGGPAREFESKVLARHPKATQFFFFEPGVWWLAPEAVVKRAARASRSIGYLICEPMKSWTFPKLKEAATSSLPRDSLLGIGLAMVKHRRRIIAVIATIGNRDLDTQAESLLSSLKGKNPELLIGSRHGWLRPPRVPAAAKVRPLVRAVEEVDEMEKFHMERPYVFKQVR